MEEKVRGEDSVDVYESSTGGNLGAQGEIGGKNEGEMNTMDAVESKIQINNSKLDYGEHKNDSSEVENSITKEEINENANIEVETITPFRGLETDKKCEEDTIVDEVNRKKIDNEEENKNEMDDEKDCNEIMKKQPNWAKDYTRMVLDTKERQRCETLDEGEKKEIMDKVEKLLILEVKHETAD